MTWKLMENAISFFDKVSLAKFCLTSDHFTNGKKVKELEDRWSNWIGCKHSLFVSSGSAANFLLIASVKEMLNLQPGDKVLIPACTWMTSVAPIIQLGLTPIFCDINIEDFSFDYAELKYISKKHHDIKLIFVTHLLGFTSKVRVDDTLSRLFPNAKIIDDACESHGCKNKNFKIGAIQDTQTLGVTFSTYFGHHFTSIEGGFVSTNDSELYDLMKMKRSHGMARESIFYDMYAAQYPNIDKQFLFITDGYNFRNTDLNAVLGLSQLSRLDKSLAIRNQNYKDFCKLTKKYDQILYPIEFSENSSNFCLPMISKTSQQKLVLQDQLKKNKIEYRPVVSGNLLQHPFLTGYSVCSKKKQLTVDLIHKNGLYIGNNQFVNLGHLFLLEKILKQL